MAVLLFQEVGNVGNADLHFKRSGYAVEGFHASAGDVLSVLVEIDEARGDHQSLGAEHALARQGLGRNARDLAVADADIAGGVEAGLGIHRTSALDDEVVLLGDRGGGQHETQRDQR